MRAAFREALDEHTGPVLKALAQSAQCLGKDGHADRKLFLQLVGIDAESEEEVIGVSSRRAAAEAMSDAELIAMFEGREHMLPIGVLRRLGKDPDAELDKGVHPDVGRASDKPMTTQRFGHPSTLSPDSNAGARLRPLIALMFGDGAD
jgi:hypothetical protein